MSPTSVHRHPLDDHVVRDLVERFDEVLEALEATDVWVTARVKRPVLILGSLEGVETGIRQLIRQRPLEVEEIAMQAGNIRVPTLRETARIKAWLILQRNATRDSRRRGGGRGPFRGPAPGSGRSRPDA